MTLEIETAASAVDELADRQDKRSQWPVVSFTQLFSDVSAGQPKLKRSEYKTSGAIPVIDQGHDQVSGYTDDPAAVRRVGPPLILFGDHTRRFKFVDFDFAIGADGVKVLQIDERLDPKFAFRALESLRIPNAGYSRHFKFLKEARIPLPPLDEQRRIASILDQADALRAQRFRSLELLDELADAIFIEMFGERWDSAISLGELIEEFRYGSSSKATPGGVPVIRIPNVSQSRLDLSDLKYLTIEEAELNRLSLGNGDLLFVRSNGNREAIGTCVAFDEDEAGRQTGRNGPFVFASYLIRARLKPGTNSSFIESALRTSIVRAALLARAKTSAGQYNINIEGLRSLRIPTPALAEQVKFAHRKSALSRQRERLQKSLFSLDRLFESLQREAFAANH